MKKVSVIIPVYGVEKYIAATVRSVLEQTYTNFELLIIDDGSPDNSIKVCQQFTDSRIQIIRQENRGVAAARNTGIRLAQGDYIAFLDADDLWVPQKLEKHVKHLESSPSVGISFSYSAFIDEAGDYLGFYRSLEKTKDITPLNILFRDPISSGSNLVARREVLDDIKFQDNLYGTVEDFYLDEDRKLHPSEDTECWFRIAIQSDWQFEGIPEALILYRLHSGGHSANLLKKAASWERFLEKARIYAPEIMAKWEDAAMAYQLTSLARRAISLRSGAMALQLGNQALKTHWKILLEEPTKTFLTFAAAYLLCLLPHSLYIQMETLALKIKGAKQKKRILQNQSS